MSCQFGLHFACLEVWLMTKLDGCLAELNLLLQWQVKYLAVVLLLMLNVKVSFKLESC